MTTVKEPVETFVGVPKPVKAPMVVPVREPVEVEVEERELVPVRVQPKQAGRLA